MFALQDDYGVRQVHTTKRSLRTIASRSNIIHQDIPLFEKVIPDIIDIPEDILNVRELPKPTKKIII